MSEQVKSESTSLGAYAAACLRENGVEVVFGIPGTHNIEIYRGLTRHEIRHVLTRHEQGAVYAADGYARASGRPGVVIATSGPGVTNCITGIANAYADSVPMLVLSPGAPVGQERRDLGFLHEVKDQRSGIAQFAAASIRVESRGALEQAINGAFLSWRTGRCRPVHIEIPSDLMGSPTKGVVAPAWLGSAPVAPEGQIGAVLAAIQNARRPLIVAGGGCVESAAELRRLVEATGIPVVTTMAGKGSLSESHPLSCGALAGSSTEFPPIASADLILALGTELKSAPIGHETIVARFDLDPTQLNKHHRAAIPVLGELSSNLRSLLTTLPGTRRADPDWQKRALDSAQDCRRSAEDKWAVFHEAIALGAKNSAPGKELIITGDSSQVSYQGTLQAAVIESPRRFLTTDGYATLGYAVPAAIGASLASKGIPVVAVLGDGAFMFSVQELATASELGLPLPIVIYDNGGYAEIEQNMEEAGIAPFAIKLNRPDYFALASAFHCEYYSAATPTELEAAIGDALTDVRPSLIVVCEADHQNTSWR
ncbi:thiamine pyrophosphate-binding protein [Homoserinimonas sp. OAct 916]|uniref:thiamine pyrophosphate-binding protein n=1 Tax=Homoserinimonas sp. OAct 916 TaxID=2211450 RepID=UPI000DBE76D2|nr:thiamine pyrophosphate-binding protein [Homoserinimonas sp. OAct 916]